MDSVRAAGPSESMVRWVVVLFLMSTLGCRAVSNRPLEGGPDCDCLPELLAHFVRPRSEAAASAPVRPVVLAVHRLESTTTAALELAVRTRRILDATLDDAHPDPRVEELGGPPELGLPFQIDFGVGEAPYDDGTLPRHRGGLGRGGFSDTVLSLVWLQPVGSGLALRAHAALAREQDLALLEGLAGAQFAFAAFGLSVSF